jgi:hypothetical protein
MRLDVLMGNKINQKFVLTNQGGITEKTVNQPAKIKMFQL